MIPLEETRTEHQIISYLEGLTLNDPGLSP